VDGDLAPVFEQAESRRIRSRGKSGLFKRRTVDGVNAVLRHGDAYVLGGWVVPVGFRRLRTGLTGERSEQKSGETEELKGAYHRPAYCKKRWKVYVPESTFTSARVAAQPTTGGHLCVR